MTQRLKGVYVTFDKDIREDDAQFIINAIRAIRHVTDVTPLESGSDDWMARQHVRRQIADRFQQLWNYIETGKD